MVLSFCRQLDPFGGQRLTCSVAPILFPFLLVAAPLKMVQAPKRVPFFPRVTEQLRSDSFLAQPIRAEDALVISLGAFACAQSGGRKMRWAPRGDIHVVEARRLCFPT